MIVWDEAKNVKLKIERNISFEEICEVLLKEEYLDILENPTRPNQNIFVVEISNYIYAVPFVIDKGSTIILKTAYPSRKLFKRYRGV